MGGSLSANQRGRAGRRRKKEPRELGAELQDSKQEQQSSEQEVEYCVEVESHKGEGESDRVEERKSSEPEPAISGQLELPEQGQIEHAEQEQVEQVTREQKPCGGKKVAESSRAEIFQGFAKNESFFSLEGVKKAAAWYIETGEKLAQTLELQEKATG
jgi:hypothetical protein